MRPTRVVYVEDDPALRGIISSLLSARPELEMSLIASGSKEALEATFEHEPDVGLLDLALGYESLNGLELAVLLRERFPDMGVVIFTQHVVPDVVTGLPEKHRMGWSFLEKRADLNVDYVVEVLQSTARGLSVVDESMSVSWRDMPLSPVARLSWRQREVMALRAQGREATSIAEELGMSQTAIRKELSRAYSLLVPDAQEGTDIRTVAVLRYLRAMRGRPEAP